MGESMLLLVGLSTIGVLAGLTIVTYHADRNRIFVARWVIRIAGVTGARRAVVVRMLIPLCLWATSIVLFAVLANLLLGDGRVAGLVDDSVGVAIVLGVLSASVLLGVLLMPVSRKGRPRLLVVPPCRQMGLEEIDEWVEGSLRLGRARDGRN